MDRSRFTRSSRPVPPKQQAGKAQPRVQGQDTTRPIPPKPAVLAEWPLRIVLSLLAVLLLVVAAQGIGAWPLVLGAGMASAAFLVISLLRPYSLPSQLAASLASGLLGIFLVGELPLLHQVPVLAFVPVALVFLHRSAAIPLLGGGVVLIVGLLYAYHPQIINAETGFSQLALVQLSGGMVLLGSLSGYLAWRQAQQRMRGVQLEPEIMEQILNKAPFGLCVTDMEGNFTQVNQAYLDMYGFRREEVEGQSFLKVVPKEVAPTWMKIHKEYMAGKNEVKGEFEVRRKDGQPMSILTDSIRIRRPNGALEKLTYVTDITEVARLRDQARQQNELIEKLVNEAPFGICVTDWHGNFVRVNKSYCAIYGFREEEIIGQPFTLVVPPEDKEQWMQVHRDYMEGKCEVTGEFEVRGMDGSPIHILTDSIRVRTPEGNLEKITYVTDITELHRVKDAVEANNHMVEQLVADAPVGICITDYHGHFVRVNNSYCTIYGYTSEELVGQSFTVVVPPEDKEQWMQVHRDYMQGKCEVNGEFEVRGKGGRPVHIWTSSILATTANGEKQKITYVIDITETKQNQAKLENAQREMEETLMQTQSQEEELRQQTEELMATQEQMKSVEKELREKQIAMERNQRLESDLAKFDEIMRLNFDKDLEDFADTVMYNVAKKVGAEQGVMYVKHIGEGQEQVLTVAGGYAYNVSSMKNKRIHFSEGLIGQAARTRDTFTYNDLPGGAELESATVKVPLTSLIVCPLINNEEVQGVMELAGLQAFDEERVEFLERLSKNLGAMLYSVLNNLRTRQLLKQTQEMTHQLHNHTQELSQEHEDLKASQHQLEEAKKKIWDKQRQLERMAGSVPGVIFQLKQYGQQPLELFYVSDGSRELLNLDPASLTEPQQLFNCLHPEDRNNWDEKLQQLIRYYKQLQLSDQAGQMQSWEWEGRLDPQQFTDPAGQARWVHLTGRVELANGEVGAEGKALLITAIMQDVTQLKQSQLEIKRKTEEIAAYNREIEAQKDNMLDSFRYAQRIQQAILPSQEIIDSRLPQNYIWYAPKDILSGDFYWYNYNESNNRSLIAACDCTGHGVPGAFMSVLGYSLLNYVVEKHEILKPSRMLSAVDIMMRDVLAEPDEHGKTKVQDGMDISLLAIDHQRKVLEYAGAQNPFFLLREGELTVIKGDKQSIGGDSEEEKQFTNHLITPQPGDRFFLFSDGLVDQFGGPRNKKFTSKRLRNLLTETAELDLQEQSARLRKTLEEWRADTPQTDDICLIALEATPELFRKQYTRQQRQQPAPFGQHHQSENNAHLPEWARPPHLQPAEGPGGRPSWRPPQPAFPPGPHGPGAFPG